MKHKKSIGLMIKKLSNQVKRTADRNTNSSIEGITRLHLMIIGYIGSHNDEDIFQKNIEERFNIRRSTASGILQLMEKNDLIVRKSVDYDARLKKIILTEKSNQIHILHHQDIEILETKLRNGLTEREVDTFLNIAEKILENAKL